MTRSLQRGESLDTTLAWRLRGAPRLRASYMARRNSAPRGGARRRLVQVGIIAAWLLSAFLCGTHRDATVATIAWIESNRWLVAGVLLVVTSSLVLRQRAALRAGRTRDWLAALPVVRSIELVEIHFYALLPMAWLLATLWAASLTAGITAVFGGLKLASLASIACDLTAGPVGGALIGLVIPLQKPEELPPGSRYVPHRQLGNVASIVPSTRALGIWPIRQMFASARPKSVARASILLLLAMPLNSTADVAMVFIGLCALLGMFCLLILGVVTTTAAARRWLAPLPLTGTVMTRASLLPSLAFAAAGTLVEAWLLSLLQVGAVRAAAYAFFTFVTVVISGSLSVVVALSRRRQGFA